MRIEDMFDFYGYKIDLATMSEEQQLQLWSIYAYWVDRTDDIRHTNCSTLERDTLLRRRDKKVCRSVEDVIDGDYGHC